MPQQVDDLEAARKALGYGRIDLLSESAGTRMALIYAWRYPKSIHRSVMIGVNPPGHFLWDPKTTDEQIRRYAALCAKDARAASAPTTSPRRSSARGANIPGSLLAPADQEGNARIASFFGLMESSTGRGAALRPDDYRLLALRRATATRAGSGSRRCSRDSSSRSVRLGRIAAVGRVDARVARALYASGAHAAFDHRQARRGLSWAAAGCAMPGRRTGRRRYKQVRTSKVETLPHRRNARFRDAAADRDRSSAVPAERPRGHPHRARAHGFFAEQPEAGSG